MSEHDSKPLYSLTVGEYIELNKKVFSEAAAKLLQGKPGKSTEEVPGDIIFMDDVIQLTGYKKATVYSKVSRYEIPVLSRRKPLTFSRAAILQWLQDGKPGILDQEANTYLNRT